MNCQNVALQENDIGNDILDKIPKHRQQKQNLEMAL